MSHSNVKEKTDLAFRETVHSVQCGIEEWCMLVSLRIEVGMLDESRQDGVANVAVKCQAHLRFRTIRL